MKQFFFFAAAIFLLALNASSAVAETLQDRQQQRVEKIEKQERAKQREQENLEYTKKSYEKQVETNELLKEVVEQNKTIIKQNRDLNDILTVFVSEFTDFDAKIEDSSFEDNSYQGFEAVVPVEPIEFPAPPIEDDGLSPLPSTEPTLLIEIN